MKKEELLYVRAGDTVITERGYHWQVLTPGPDGFHCVPCPKGPLHYLQSARYYCKFYDIVDYIYRKDGGKAESAEAHETMITVPVTLRKCWVREHDTDIWFERWYVGGTNGVIPCVTHADVPTVAQIAGRLESWDYISDTPPKTREMTVAEIEKRVGCPLKIVKEKRQ